MSSITHEATIKLNLDFVDSAGLRKLEASLEAIKTALDLTRFNEKWEALNNTIHEQGLEIQRLNQQLKTQVVTQEKVTAATKKQLAAQKLLNTNRKVALSKDWSQYGFDPKQGKTIGLPAGLAGNWKTAMTGMASSLKTLKVEMGSAEGMTDKLARGLQTIRTSADRSDDAIRATGRAFSDAKKSVKVYENELAALRSQYAQLVNADKKNVGAIQAMERAVRSLIAREAEHSARMKKELPYRISFYERQVDAIHRAAFRIGMAGMNLQQFARNIFNFGRQTMDVFGEYEFALNRAAGALSVWQESVIEGQDGTTYLSNSILDLAGSLKIIPAKEAAEAMYYFASATGLVIDNADDMNDAVKSLDVIMKASIMTNTGYEDTIKGVYSILTQFYHGALSETTAVTEKLFFVTQKTAVEFNDLIQAFKMVGPVAAQAGATFDDMVNLLGRLGDLGIRGSMAGRAFRQMFIQMVRPSGPAKKAIDNLFYSISSQAEKFGQEYKDIFGGKSYLQVMFPQGEFVGTEKYIHNLALAVDTLTRSERNAFLGRISTANELPVITALVADEIKKMHGLASETEKTQNLAVDSSEYFQKNWDRFASTWKSTVGTIQRTWERMQITVGSLVAKALTPFVGKIEEVVKGLREWADSPANQGIIQFLAKVGAGIAVLAGFAGAILSIGGALTGLAASAYVIVKAFGQYVPAFAGFMGGITALVDSAIRNFDMLSDAVNQTVADFESVSREGADVFGALKGFLDALVAPLRLVTDLIMVLVAGFIRLTGIVGKFLGDLGILKPLLVGIGSIIGVLMVRNTALWVKGLVAARLGLTALTIAGMRKNLVGLADSIRLMGMYATDIPKGLGAAKGALGALVGMIGGPIGLIALGVGIGSMAYEVFPEVKNFVDSITSSFRDTNKEAQEFIAGLGEMGSVVNANFRKLADQRYAEEFNKNWSTAFEAVKNARAGLGDLWTRGFVEINGQNQPIDTGQDDATNATAIAQSLTPSADSLTTAMIESLKQTMAGINAARVASGIAPIASDAFIGMVASATERIESSAGLSGQSSFMVALAESVLKSTDPSSSRDKIRKAIKDYLHLAWDGTQFAIEEGITDADIDLAASRLTGVFYSQEGVDKKMSDILTNIWTPYVEGVISAIEKGASPAEIQRMMTTTFSGKGSGSLSGALSEVLLSLDADLQKQVNDALQAAGMGDTEGIIGADTQKTLQSMAGEKYNALTTAIMENTYRQYQKVEDATQSAYDSAMVDLVNGDMGHAAMIFNTQIADLLRQRAFSPEAQAAWMAFGEGLEAVGAVAPGTVARIKKQSEEHADDSVSKLFDAASKAIEEALRERLDTLKERFAAMPQLVRDSIHEFQLAGIQVADAVATAQKAFTDSMTVATSRYAGPRTLENAERTKRSWMDSFMEATIPTEKDMKDAMKRIESGHRTQGRIVKGLNSLILKELLGSKTGAEREAGRDYADTFINTLIAQFNAAQPGGKRQHSIARAVARMLNDPTMPEYIKKVLERQFSTALANVEIDAPTTSGSSGGTFLETLYKNIGLQTGKGTSEKKPAQVFLKVHVSQSGANKTRDVVVAAKEKIEGALNAIRAMPWAAVGNYAGSTLRIAFMSGLNIPAFQKVAWSIRGKFRDVQWYSGGSMAGGAWARGFNQAVQDTIAKTLTFVASVTIGNSPPPSGPLKDIDKGGANAGMAWADGYGKAARERLMYHTQRMRDASYGERMGLVTEETYNGKKEISIHMDVSSKDGSVDRAKQGEFRRGAMDALVAADLEHYVTVS